MKSKWFEKKWLVWLLLLLFFPIGLYALWKNSYISKTIKIVVTIFIAILLLFNISKNNKTVDVELESKYIKELNNLDSICRDCWQAKISLCDSIVKHTSYNKSIFYNNLRDTIYYKSHVFELNDTNFINRSKYYTSYTNSVNFNTKTVLYRKDFVNTELFVYKEAVRKSIIYFTEFPSLDEINIILYAKESGKKYLFNIKRTTIEEYYAINWNSLRIGKPSAYNYGYTISNDSITNYIKYNKDIKNNPVNTTPSYNSTSSESYNHVGKRGGIYHYSKSGKKVYSKRH